MEESDFDSMDLDNLDRIFNEEETEEEMDVDDPLYFETFND